MAVELKIAAFGALLLLVHILVARSPQDAAIRSTGTSARATKHCRRIRWPGGSPGAQANFQETFPVAIVALLGVAIAAASEWTALGGWIWLGARTIYLPLYGFGARVSNVRSWSASSGSRWSCSLCCSARSRSAAGIPPTDC